MCLKDDRKGTLMLVLTKNKKKKSVNMETLMHLRHQHELEIFSQ